MNKRIADCLGRDQDAFGVHSVEDVAEALVLLADQFLRRHRQIVEKDFRRLVVDHGLQRADFHPVPARFTHVDQEHRQPVGPPLHLLTDVVRASSSIISDWSARDVHTFWPLTM